MLPCLPSASRISSLSSLGSESQYILLSVGRGACQLSEEIVTSGQNVVDQRLCQYASTGKDKRLYLYTCVCNSTRVAMAQGRFGPRKANFCHQHSQFYRQIREQRWFDWTLFPLQLQRGKFEKGCSALRIHCALKIS